MTNNAQSFSGLPGLWNANSYVASGIPYTTGSTVATANFATLNSQIRIDFPFVTRSITVISRATADIRIHFNSLADGRVEAGRHYMTLANVDSSITFNVKSKQIFISLATTGSDGDFELFAELTNIPSREMFPLTGSGLTV